MAWASLLSHYSTFCLLGINFYHSNVPNNSALITKTRSLKLKRETFQEIDLRELQCSSVYLWIHKQRPASCSKTNRGCSIKGTPPLIPRAPCAAAQGCGSAADTWLCTADSECAKEKSRGGFLCKSISHCPRCLWDLFGSWSGIRDIYHAIAVAVESTDLLHPMCVLFSLWK